MEVGDIYIYICGIIFGVEEKLRRGWTSGLWEVTRGIR